MRNKYFQDSHQFDLHIKLGVEPDRLIIEAARSPLMGMADMQVQDGADFDESLAGRELLIHPPYVLPLEKFRARREWKEVCVWTVAFSQHTSKPEGIINLFAEAYPARWNSGQIAIVHGRLTHVHILVPFKDSDYSEMSFRVFLPSAESRLFSNLPFELVPFEQISATPMEDLPNLFITGPDTMTPGELASFDIAPTYLGEPTQRRLSVELETVNGYLPKSRIELQGPGTFKARALDLEPGDSMKIKAGFRYRPSVAEKEVKIV